jgi:hypothetical protein
MSTGDLPPWPVERELTVEGYQRRLAEAAIARLRKAVEHINHAPRCAMMQPVGRMACDCGYHEAVALIGDIPEGT